jgi:hypothetical protein
MSILEEYFEAKATVEVVKKELEDGLKEIFPKSRGVRTLNVNGIERLTLPLDYTGELSITQLLQLKKLMKAEELNLEIRTDQEMIIIKPEYSKEK